MTPAAKALWYIETHSSEAPAPDEIARSAGVSRFHHARAFGYATGVPVVTYVRARRLAEAAKELAQGSAGHSGCSAGERDIRRTKPSPGHFGISSE